MNPDRPYFFCGIGGSGMLPLASILKAKGFAVSGSDRALDQGRTAMKFDTLRGQGIALFPQDGSGIVGPDQIVVTSAAVEETVPDVQAAHRVGATLIRRAALLAELFNAARDSVAVGGTSGKSTTTGMIGWILHALGQNPTIVNGAVMKNFISPASPFASSVIGDADLFVAEVDESDGSIAQYNPGVAILNNVALDHKSMEELRALFGDFVRRARIAVLNLDNAETAAFGAGHLAHRAITFSLVDPTANLRAANLQPQPASIVFDVVERESQVQANIHLHVPGAHNVANALAALGAARALGVPLADAARALSGFRGIRRRLEHVGTANGITVIDDFAHNPDKIAATLATLHAFPGRLLIMFQPHGYGPLRLMREGFIDVFATQLGREDRLILSDPAYFGGTVERTVTSADIAQGIRDRGRAAEALGTRAACGQELIEIAKSGDRIVVMGARDDTLSQFAEDLVAKLAS